ncbi:MAG: hypothetical protein A4E31_00501 [Methanomassiliicoccales archaeon PtaU1.Bin030]|nr:MAG: hypothetical protein A4E31_00501 [Methanomassiliicoccales archaeon PtaU1.Bin030]
MTSSASYRWASPGLRPRRAASTRSTCDGRISTISSTKLSGTVSHSMSVTAEDTFPCRSMTTFTPTKSSQRMALPMPATTTRLASFSQERSSSSTLRSCIFKGRFHLKKDEKGFDATATRSRAASGYGRRPLPPGASARPRSGWRSRSRDRRPGRPSPPCSVWPRLPSLRVSGPWQRRVC